MKKVNRISGGGVALLSGGLDSTVSLGLAQKNGLKVRLALTFDYGQKAARSEIKSSRLICRKLKIPHQAIKLDWLKKIAGTSPLLARSKVLPELKINELSDLRITKHSGRQVWIPNRNAVFISIAAAFAESLHCSYIIAGFNREEARTFPDNSVAFIRAINKSLGYSTLNRVKVISFTGHLDKKQIVKVGRKIKSPLERTWSCYQGGPKPCGKCESCLRRIRAEYMAV